jgi:hypothetical protein
MNIIGTLKPATPGQKYVTWREGKRQIRALLAKAKIKPVGTFRARKVNRNQFTLNVEGGGFVTATRQPNADVSIQTVEAVNAKELSAKLMADILAQG